MGLDGSSSQQPVTKYNGILTNESILGTTIPLVYGQQRVSWKLLWFGDFTAQKDANSGGKGGGSGLGKGKGQATYVYYASVLGAVCQGPCNALIDVYSTNGKFEYQMVTEEYIIGGDYTYTVANNTTFTADAGVYWEEIFGYTVNDYGSPAPVNLTGTYNTPYYATTSSPGVGQYTIDPTTGMYTFNAANAGQTVYITYAYYEAQLISSEIGVVPASSPYQITVQNQGEFKADEGVVYYPSGTALTAVGGTPTTKGTYNPNGGNYLFSAADAGLGINISYLYQDYNTAQDKNAPSTLNLTFIGGQVGQSPWSYLTSTFPGQDLGYSEICCVGSANMYLGYGATLPQYNFEIAGYAQFGAGIVDACPSDCIEDILIHPTHGIGFPSQYIDSSLQGQARNQWVANNFFISPLLDSQTSASSSLGDWLESGQTYISWDEGRMKFIPLGDTSVAANGVLYSPPTQPVVSLTDYDFIVEEGKPDDPVKFEATSWQSRWNRVQVEWAVRANDYNTDVLYAQDEGSIERYGLMLEDKKSWSFICTENAAQWAANMRIQRLTNIYLKYTFNLAHTYKYLSPGDIVEITDTVLGLNAAPVRIVKIEDDPKKGLTIEAENFPWSTAHALLNTKQAVAASYTNSLGNQYPGDTAFILMELPDQAPAITLANTAASYTGNRIVAYVNGETNFWGGCLVYVSLDGTNYNYVARITQPARIGMLGTGVPAFYGTNPDTLDVLNVNMAQSGATLDSTSDTTAGLSGTLAGVTSTAYDSNDNPYNVVELLSYTGATLTGPNQYTLNGLYRGLYGTPAVQHYAEDPFVRMDQASYIYQFPDTLYGSTIYFKFCSFNLIGNQVQTLTEVDAVPFYVQGLGPGAVDGGSGVYRPGAGSMPNSWTGSFSYTAQLASAPITAVSISGSTVTFTAANTFTAGDIITVSGLANLTFLNTITGESATVFGPVIGAGATQIGSGASWSNVGFINYPSYTGDAATVTTIASGSQSGYPSAATGGDSNNPWQTPSAIFSTSYSTTNWNAAFNNFYETSTYTFGQAGTGFGFSVPAGATISGVYIQFYGASGTYLRSASFNNPQPNQYPYVGLTYGGGSLGTIVSSGTLMNSAGGLTSTVAFSPPEDVVGNGVFYSFGGPGYTFGASLTPAMVNDPSFGFFVSPQGTPTTNIGAVVAVQNYYMVVYYTASSAINTLQSSSYGFAVPSTNTIEGVQFNVGGVDMPSGASLQANLMYGGSVVGSKVYSGTGTAFSTSFGGPSDLWGGSLTPAQVNDSSFGAQLVFSGPAGTYATNGWSIEVFGEQPQAGQQLTVSGTGLSGTQFKCVGYNTHYPTFNVTAVNMSGSTLTLTCANNLKAGYLVDLAQFVGASWLNGVTVTVATASGTQFTASYTHTSYSGSELTAIATVNNSTLPTYSDPSDSGTAFSLSSSQVVFTWNSYVFRATVPNPNESVEAVVDQNYAGTLTVGEVYPGTYYVYPFIDDVAHSNIEFVSKTDVPTGGTAVGSPPIMWTTTGNVAVTAWQGRNDHLPLSDQPLSITVPTSGTGTGTIGGTNGIPID